MLLSGGSKREWHKERKENIQILVYMVESEKRKRERERERKWEGRRIEEEG